MFNMTAARGSSSDLSLGVDEWQVLKQDNMSLSDVGEVCWIEEQLPLVFQIKYTNVRMTNRAS